MQETQEAKRLTLAVALIRVRTAQALDDLAKVHPSTEKMHHQAKEDLDDYRSQQQEQTDALVEVSQIVGGWQHSETSEEQLNTIGTLIGEDAEAILEQCEAYLAYAGNNYLGIV